MDESGKILTQNFGGLPSKLVGDRPKFDVWSEEQGYGAKKTFNNIAGGRYFAEAEQALAEYAVRDKATLQPPCY